jgi:hypothetical protein
MFNFPSKRQVDNEKPFDNLLNSGKYNPGFVDFLHRLIHASIATAANPENRNRGCYISSWVLNKENPTEMMQFEWNGIALVQDAEHDASRAVDVTKWTTNAVDMLKGFFGSSVDIDFEEIKKKFLTLSQTTHDFGVNPMIIPSTIDQSDTIANFIPLNCIHTFDNGAKKATAFGVEYVTQATIYDTGNPVSIQNDVKQFPVLDEDFVNFGTLTITVMPDVNKRELQVFVIFSHGRIIEQLPKKQIGMEGFMTFFDAKDFREGFLANDVVKFFDEKTLNANIKPVSDGRYLNENPLKKVYSIKNEIMPEYFAEIIKFMGDKNQCIMSGYFSNFPNDTATIQRFFGNLNVNQLMLVSGDRYSLEEIYRFKKSTESQILIPFTYFGGARFEKHYIKDEEGFTVVSSASRCLFSVIRKTVNYSEDVMFVMSKMRETTNIIEKYDKLAKEYDIEMFLRKEEYEKLSNQAEKEKNISFKLDDKANAELERIETCTRLMESIKQRIKYAAIDDLSKAYEHWVAHEQYTYEAEGVNARLDVLKNEYVKFSPQIDEAKAYLKQLESELSVLLSNDSKLSNFKIVEKENTESLTSFDPETETFAFDNNPEKSDINLEVLDDNGKYITLVDNNGNPIQVNLREFVEIDELYEKTLPTTPIFGPLNHINSLPSLRRALRNNPSNATRKEIEEIEDAIEENKKLFKAIVDEVIKKRIVEDVIEEQTTKKRGRDGGMPKRKYLYARKFDTARFLNIMSMLRNKLNARRKRRSNKKHQQPAKTKRLSSRKLVRKAARRTKRKI